MTPPHAEGRPNTRVSRLQADDEARGAPLVRIEILATLSMGVVAGGIDGPFTHQR